MVYQKCYRMRFSNVKFLLIEPCNFVDCPAGGQLNFARLLLDLYRDEVATVGTATSRSEPVGVWFKKTENGYTRDHFNLSFRGVSTQRYLVPRRLRSLIAYRRYRRKIHAHPCKRFFVQEHAILMAFDRDGVDSVCYRFPGVESQLSKSRFKWAPPLAGIFDFLFYRSTQKADVLLASADEVAIQEMLEKSFGFLKGRTVVQFPTRVDTTLFRKKKNAARGEPLQFISCGRLHWVKGWSLILEALALLKNKLNFIYTYVGDGPDREEFLKKVDEVGLSKSVELAGFLNPVEIAKRLRGSDLYLMGSVMEGWPTTLVEAYVTGLPMVSTSVSGARIIVQDGANGAIVSNRCPREFAAAIEAALDLDPDQVLRRAEPERYSTFTLVSDLERLWK